MVDPDKGLVEDNLKVVNALEERCPHLSGSVAGQYVCKIHNRPWFPETPCGQYNSWISWPGNIPCQMGVHIIGKLKGQKYKKRGKDDGTNCDNLGGNHSTAREDRKGQEERRQRRG